MREVTVGHYGVWSSSQAPRMRTDRDDQKAGQLYWSGRQSDHIRIKVITKLV